MELTILTPQDPETTPSSSRARPDRPERPDRPQRRRSVAGSVLVVVALGAAVAATVAALTGGDSGEREPIGDRPPVQQIGDPTQRPRVGATAVGGSHYLACMASSGAGTADRLEQAAPKCWAFAEQVERCIATSAATPDAVERWIDSCRARASATGA